MKGTHALVCAVAVAACGWLAAPAAQSRGDAAAQLQAAMHRETVAGDVSGAIAEYRRIADSSTDRTIKARALLRLAAAYEKTGRPDAAGLYSRVAREYRDVQDVASAADARLAALHKQTKAAGSAAPRTDTQLSVDLAWGDGAVTSWNSISADGRLLTFVELKTLNVMLRNMETGATRAVTTEADGTSSEIWDHAISPDGEWLAYTYVAFGHKDGKSQQGDTELRIMRVDGSDRRTLATWNQTYSVNGVAWSPDQKHLVVGTSVYGGRKQAIIFHLASGRQRVLLDDPVRAFHAFSFSPEGRRLLVTFQRKFQTAETDVSVLELDAELGAAREHLLLGGDWPEHAFGWSPDGQQVVFQSTRNDSPGVWRVPVTHVRPSGQPVLIRPLEAQTQFGAITRDGALFYGQTTRQRNAMIATLDVAARRVTDARRATQRYEDVTTALGWSPDGRWFAYTRPAETLVLRDESNGTERDVKLPFATVRRLQWHPDSRGLVVSGVHGDVNGVHHYAFTDGTVTLLMKSPDNPPLAYGILGPDGTSLYVTSPWQRISRHAAGTERMLIDTGSNSEAFWYTQVSHDGMTLAALQPSTLWLVPTRGGPPVEAFKVPGNDTLRGVTWLPDGENLVLIRSGQEGHPYRVLRYSSTTRSTSPVDAPLPFGEPDVEFSSFHAHPNKGLVAYTPLRMRSGIWRMQRFLSKP